MKLGGNEEGVGWYLRWRVMGQVKLYGHREKCSLALKVEWDLQDSGIPCFIGGF